MPPAALNQKSNQQHSQEFPQQLLLQLLPPQQLHRIQMIKMTMMIHQQSKPPQELPHILLHITNSLQLVFSFSFYLSYRLLVQQMQKNIPR